MNGIIITNIGTIGYSRAGKSKRSSYEEIVSFILDKLRVVYEEEKIFPKLGLMRYDFFLPKQNLVIEVQGEQHFTPGFGMNEEQFDDYVARDQLKKDFAAQEGMKYLAISYRDMNEVFEIIYKTLDV